MLELYFFFYVIPRNVRKAAKPRGESTFKWTLRSWFWWVAIEVLAVLLVIALLSVTRVLFSWPDSGLATAIGVVAYLIGLAGGMTAADKVRRRLEDLPIRA